MEGRLGKEGNNGRNKTEQRGVKRATEAKGWQLYAKSGSWQSCEKVESGARGGRKVEEEKRVDGRWVTVRIGHQDSQEFEN